MSNISTNQVQELMEAYTAVYDPDLRDELGEEKEIEEFSIQIIENAAYTLFSQGYDVNDLIDYLSSAEENTIVEDFINFTNGDVLIESIVTSDEYIDGQFENLKTISDYLIREGIWNSAMNFIGRVASKPARMAAGARLANSSNPARTAKAYERLAGQKLSKAGFAKPPAGSFKNTADAARAAALAKPAGFLSKAASKVGGAFKAAKGALTKIPGAGALGKVAGKALPVAGAALYGMDAVDRAKKGDWGGAALSGLGAATSFGGPVAALAPAGIQMATDALGLTGDKSLKSKGGAKASPSSGAPKPKGGAGMVNVPGKGSRYFASSDKKYYKNYNDALAARNSRRGVTATPAPSSPSGGGRAPSAPPAPSGGGRAPSAPSAPPKAPPKAAPAASGTPMQQWAKANPTLASKVKVGQSGYDEISQIRDKPGPYEKQDQTPTQGPTPSASQQSQLNKTGYAAPEPSSTNAQSTMNNAEQERKKREKQGATSESYSPFDIVLEYLTTEGHVDTLDEALYVMMEMDGETIQNICEAYQEPRFNRKHYLKKLSKRGGMGMGTPDDPHGYRDPKMANVGDEFRKRKTAAKKAKQTGEPDSYRAASEAKASANRARGAAK